MKKILTISLIIAVVGIVYAGSIERKSKIAMTTASQLSSPIVANITAVTGQKNCINNIDIKLIGDYQLQILTGDSTDYSLILSSGQGLVRSWDDADAICTENSEALQIKLTTITAGTFEINYSGFRY